MYRIGTGNWSATQWSDTSGGTPATQWFPLAQDTAIFDTGTTTGTHTIDVGYYIGTFDASALNVAATLATGTTTPTFYGSVTLDADLTLSGTGALFFSGRTTQTITSAGRTFTQPLTVDSPSGTVVLADALTTNGAFTLTTGTLTFTDLTLTCLTFTATNANPNKVMNFGTTGKVVITGNNTTVLDWAVSGTLIANAALMNGSKQFELTYSGGVGTRTARSIFQGGIGTEFNRLPNIKVTAGTDVISTTSGTGAVYFDELDFTGFAGSASWSDTVFLTGNLVISTGMTLGATTNPLYFYPQTSTTLTVTSNGKPFNFPVLFGDVSPYNGTVQLIDNLTVGAANAVTFTAGTLDIDGKTLSVDNFSSSNSNTRVIDFGTNGVLEVRGTGTAFNAATGTNLTTTGTGNISFVSGYTKTFAGGGLTYPTLSHNGAGILTVTGANTFANINNTYDGLYNLLTFTEQFDNAAWTKTGTTVAANTTTAPDSTSTADTLAETAATSTHDLLRADNVVITSGVTYTFSVYVKKGPGGSAPDVIQLLFFGASFPVGYANFNLSTGSWGTTSGVTTIAPVNAGSGWYRLAITATATGSSSAGNGGGISFTNNNDALGRRPSYAGNTAADLYVWGAQLVQGTAAIDYQRVAAPNDWATIPEVPGMYRYNLLSYTEEFDNAAWTKFQTSITANTTTAPDGTTTADALIEDTSTSQHYTQISTSGVILANVTYTLSAYVKAAGRDKVFIGVEDRTNVFARAYFDLTTLAVATAIANYAITSTSIVDVGSGWRRISVTVSSGAVDSSSYFIIGLRTNLSPDSSGNFTNSIYTGDGTSGIYVWGAQLVPGSSAQTYQAVGNPALWVNTTTLTLPSSTTTTVNDFNLNGTAGNLVTLNSSSPGVQATLVKV
jgi:hypothetical protein